MLTFVSGGWSGRQQSAARRSSPEQLRVNVWTRHFVEKTRSCSCAATKSSGTNSYLCAPASHWLNMSPPLPSRLLTHECMYASRNSASCPSTVLWWQQQQTHHRFFSNVWMRYCSVALFGFNALSYSAPSGNCAHLKGRMLLWLGGRMLPPCGKKETHIMTKKRINTTFSLKETCHAHLKVHSCVWGLY